MHKIESYYPICPKYKKKTQVDIRFFGYKNPKDIAITWRSEPSTHYCHLCPSRRCELGDLPCLREILEHTP